MTGAFARLHPAVRHHVVNSLGWRSLRALQEQAIAPILADDHAVLGAPTAGGKTEAAVLPLFSRMAEEAWSGLTVLYVCPLRALLNNLQPRIAGYAELLGRRCAMWHGDVGQGERARILRDPPDVLLTTPESLEAMFLSRRVDAAQLLGRVRTVVVDEVHAFAGDDRGWHLLAVLARLDELCAREVQRLGLTATVGNPAWLAGWLACGGARPARAVVVEDDTPGMAPELTVDWVASVGNAASVIAALHRGEKRLVFADSRARVEELATALRAKEVTTFVSHSSLSRDERAQAERAFSESRDCVIVATSTLELGIDVGDLDRVIQVGAPATVASLRQRLGRTGRRAGSRRNCLFLATTRMELLQALALSRLVDDGWVEPLVPPARPTQLLVQQLLARVIADGRVGRSTWPGPLERVLHEADLGPAAAPMVLEELLAQEVLVEDHGLVSVGEVGERRFGKRNFLDLTSLFLTSPLLTARWGQREIGLLDPSALESREGGSAVVLLGGRAWGVEEIDWKRRVVWLKPTDDPGRVRWSGGGIALSREVCGAIRDVLASEDEASEGPASGPPAGATLTRRAVAELEVAREEIRGVRSGRTLVERDDVRERTRWWTFAGGRANIVIAAALRATDVDVVSSDDLAITVAGSPPVGRLRAVAGLLLERARGLPVDPRRRDELKFGSELPEAEAELVIRERSLDPGGATAAVAEPAILRSG